MAVQNMYGQFALFISAICGLLTIDSAHSDVAERVAFSRRRDWAILIGSDSALE